MLHGIGDEERAELLRALDLALESVGVDARQTTMSPREVQEYLLREGMNPEDNLGSRAIIEDRNQRR